MAALLKVLVVGVQFAARLTVVVPAFWMPGSTVSSVIVRVEPAATVTTPSALKVTPPPVAITVPVPVISRVSTVLRLAVSVTPSVESSWAVTLRSGDRVLRSAPAASCSAVTVTVLPVPLMAATRSASAAERLRDAVSTRLSVVTPSTSTAASVMVTRLLPVIVSVSTVERLALRLRATVAASWALTLRVAARVLRSAPRLSSSAVTVTALPVPLMAASRSASAAERLRDASPVRLSVVTLFANTAASAMVSSPLPLTARESTVLRLALRSTVPVLFS